MGKGWSLQKRVWLKSPGPDFLWVTQGAESSVLRDQDYLVKLEVHQVPASAQQIPFDTSRGWGDLKHVELS